MSRPRQAAAEERRRTRKFYEVKYNMLSKQLLVKICFGLVVGIGLLSCERDPFTTNPNHKLEFSVDTVKFDTVFSTISSITLELRVYNRHNKAIKISKLWLEGGSNSVF